MLLQKLLHPLARCYSLRILSISIHCGLFSSKGFILNLHRVCSCCSSSPCRSLCCLLCI